MRSDRQYWFSTPKESIPRRKRSPTGSPIQMCCFSQKHERLGVHCVENLAGNGEVFLLRDSTRRGKLYGTKRQIILTKDNNEQRFRSKMSTNSGQLPVSWLRAGNPASLLTHAATFYMRETNVHCSVPTLPALVGLQANQSNATLKCGSQTVSVVRRCLSPC